MKNVDKSTITDTNNYHENTKVTNNHKGNTYKHGVTDLNGSLNTGKQSFDLSAGLMNLVAMQNLDASTAIVTTPEKAMALLNMNAQLDQPYEIKGAYLI